MANTFLLFTIITAVVLIEIRGDNESDIQFVCGKSKHIKKCGCWEETDRFENIPLFNVDCSRLEFKSNPTVDELPFLMGHLDLSHNKIANLNDSNKLTSETLYFLDLSYNRIKTISKGFFSGLSQLQQLNLGHNKMYAFEKEMFEGLSQLKVLNIEANKFKGLNADTFFSPLIHLEDLSLSHNHLGLFIFNNGLSNYLPKQIKHLFLDNIYLKTINSTLFKDMEQLKKLSIANNPIQELAPLKLNHLEYLDITATNVSNITERSLSFPKLKVLKMNRLPHLTKISEYAFYNMPHLEELHIEHCIRLEEMKVVFGSINDENKTCNVRLKKIHLNHNKLISLPYTLENVFGEASEIYLAENNWHCDCKISWIQNLRKNIKDYDSIRCHSPETEANKTFASLEKQLPCLQAKSIQITIYKPIQSWLFPTVGILSIIVICLLAVLLYLGPYGSSKYKANVKYFGPNSPYNQITILPNQAE